MENNNNKIIDTHAHFLDDKLNFNSKEIENNLKSNNIIFHVAWNIESSKKIIELNKQYSNLLPVIGVHPSHVKELSIEIAKQELIELIKSNKIYAIGEIGIDLFHVQDTLELQNDFFRMQLELASLFKLPVVLHIRDAYEEALKILEEFKDLTILVHSWNSDSINLEKYISLPHNVYFGINGIVTFKNAKELLGSIDKIPLDKIVLETDMPYLAPIPYRGKRNQSSYIIEVAKKVSELLGNDLETLIKQVNKNSKEFYGLS